MSPWLETAASRNRGQLIITDQPRSHRQDGVDAARLEAELQEIRRDRRAGEQDLFSQKIKVPGAVRRDLIIRNANARLLFDRKARKGDGRNTFQP